MEREYKDVIRIEANGSLQNTLRRKQLGFERLQVGNGIRMVYKDSANNLHYFNESIGVGGGFWQSGQYGGIHYNGGNVGIGREPRAVDPVRLEVQDDSGGNHQMRLTRVASADMGVDSNKVFQIRMYNYSTNDRLLLGTGNFGFISESYSRITYNSSPGEMLLQTEMSHDIRASAGRGVILESGNSELLFKKMVFEDSTKVTKDACRIYSNEHDELTIYRNNNSEHISLGSNSFRINVFSASIECSLNEAMLIKNNSGDIKLNAGGAKGYVVLESSGAGGVLVKSGTSTARIVVDGDGSSLRFCRHFNENSNNNRDELYIKGNSVGINTSYFKLPVFESQTENHPAHGDWEEGFMYVNKTRGKVYLYINSQWRELYSWA